MDHFADDGHRAFSGNHQDADDRFQEPLIACWVLARHHDASVQGKLLKESENKYRMLADM